MPHLTEFEICYESTNSCETGPIDITIEGRDKSEIEMEFLSTIPGDEVNIRFVGTDSNGHEITIEIPFSLIAETTNDNNGGAGY